MSDERIDEILRRLEALEEAVRERDRYDDRSRRRDRDDCDRDRRDRRDDRGDRDRRDDHFDERRVVDLIVGLVAEHVEEIVARQLARFAEMHAAPADEEQS